MFFNKPRYLIGATDISQPLLHPLSNYPLLRRHRHHLRHPPQCILQSLHQHLTGRTQRAILQMSIWLLPMKVLNAAARRPNWVSAIMMMRVIQIMVILLSVCYGLCGVGISVLCAKKAPKAGCRGELRPMQNICVKIFGAHHINRRKMRSQ